MSRILVLFQRPHVLSAEDGEAWVHQEFAALRRAPEVEAVELTALRPAAHSAGDFDWLLELRVRDARGADAVVAEPPIADLLGDLRLLGMRPTVFVAGERAEEAGA